MHLILITLTLTLTLLITNTISQEKKEPYLIDMFPLDSETKFDLGKKCNLTSIKDHLCSKNFIIWPCKLPCVLEAVGLMENVTFLMNEAYNNVKSIHPDHDQVEFRAFITMCEAEKSDEWNGDDRCLKTRRLFSCLIRDNYFGDFWGVSEDCSTEKNKCKLEFWNNFRNC